MSYANSNSNARRLLALIISLMNHYWVGSELMKAREQQVRDWLEDLGEFPADIVAIACREWRQQPDSRRPLPGDIRSLCIQEQRRRAEKQQAIEDKNREQYGPPWEPWLYELWGPASTGSVLRDKAMIAQEARYLRSELLRDKPADCVADVSLMELRDRFTGRYSPAVIEAAYLLIGELMERRREAATAKAAQ